MTTYLEVELILLIVVLIIALVAWIFKIDRYKTKQKQGKDWQKTGERFVDKGKLVEVYFNQKTGKRSYKEIKS